MRKIFIVGIGMGNPETITVAGQTAIAKSSGIIGAKRMLESFACDGVATCDAVSPKEIVAWIEENDEINPISVLMSGDVGFFSGTTKLMELVSDKYQVELIPGISSLQYLCAKLAIPWDKVKFVSLHGRDANFIGEVQTNREVFILTDTVSTPNYICNELIKIGLDDVRVHVGQKLSYREEKIISGNPKELLAEEFDDINVVLVQNSRPIVRDVVSAGIEDDALIRGSVPMTKSEVRSVVMSKLKVCEYDTLYDVGGGTGSVSIEMALHAKRGQVYSIECKEEAIALIQENKEKFGVSNLHIVEGMAPEAMDDLAIPDKAFIGGTRGNMAPVLAALINKNPNIKVVINVVALESLSNAMNSLRSTGYETIDIVQIAISKANERGSYHMMTAENPVFILTARGGSRD